MSFGDGLTSSPKRKHPKGWEPGVAWDGTKGSLTTQPLEHEPGDALWRDLIADWGLDPDTTEVVPGSVQIRAWDANVGGGELKRLRYYRATIRLREDADTRADVDELVKYLRRRKPIKPPEENRGSTLVVLLSDWQIGKGEGGGTPAAVERITASLDGLPHRIKHLRRSGREINAVLFAGMGDLIEQCAGNYPSQKFTVDCTRRDQMKVARELVRYAVDLVVDLVPHVVVCAVPGNHGENRENGKAFTTAGDNDDVALVEQCAEVWAAVPDRYGHVSVVLPPDDAYNLVLDCSGVNAAFAHGYKSGNGANAQAKQESWWRGHVMGNQPIADALILFTAHYHYFACSEATGRYWFQAPASDGGSAWWTEKTGQSSPSGILTMLVGEGLGLRPWSDPAIL